MQYVIVFLEGIITFVSPCLLPMLPIYLSYFAGGDDVNRPGRALKNAFGFVIGFTAVFMLLGLFAGSLGALFRQNKAWINLVMGALVVLFGLGFIGLFKLPQLNWGHKKEWGKHRGFFSAVLFGTIFSLSWTPCVGAFLGSALALASQQGSAVQGVLMLLIYSTGLGIPFMISALVIDKLKTSINWIKNHYRVINALAGILLVVVGIAMMTGLLDRLLLLMV